MRGFVGRARELGDLGRELDAARSGSGRFVTVRGRRQVGKSWLVSEFVERYGGPRMFFEAHGYTETRELERFRAAWRPRASRQHPSPVPGSPSPTGRARCWRRHRGRPRTAPASSCSTSFPTSVSGGAAPTANSSRAPRKAASARPGGPSSRCRSCSCSSGPTSR